MRYGAPMLSGIMRRRDTAAIDHDFVVFGDDAHGPENPQVPGGLTWALTSTTRADVDIPIRRRAILRP